MGRLLGRRFGAVLLLIGAAITVIWVVGLLRHKGLDWAVKFSAIAVVVFAITGPMVGPVGRVVSWLRKPQPPTPEEIISARNNLQAALSGAWSEKGSEVYEYLPMPVTFTRWIEAVGSQGPHGAVPSDAPAARQSQAGAFDSVADAFSHEPRYRRVVLGEAGAGKTVLVTELQRKLVEVPKPGDPVPVIVPAAPWRPDRQSLLDWLGERLAADYGWLPVAHARALVARGMVLPILDGLDEMPISLRPVAIARINKHHMYRPLVVTSREEEYRTAASQNRSGVKGSVAVAVQPLLSADTRRYLDPTGSGGWAQVLDDMDARGGELARVLANPLMLWLARVEYEGKSPDNLTLFGSGKSIELYLLDEFVPAVYADNSGQPIAGQFHCTAQQAKRWLGHLGAPVLAWWQINAVAGEWRRLGIGLRAAVLCTLAVILGIRVLEKHGNWRHGAYSGPVNLGSLLLYGPVGRLIQPTIHTLGMNVKGPARRDLATISHVIGAFAHQILIILAVALFVIVVARRRSLGPRLAPIRLQFRAMGVLGALILCCVLFVMAALAALLLLYLTHWPVSAAEFFSSRSTWIALLAVSLLGLITIPGSFTTRSDTSGNLSPDESLRLDRRADLAVTVSRRSAVAVAVWLFCGAQITFAYVVYAITATVVAVAMGGQNSFASRSYTDARIWLAVQGRAPWRTMDFLADANRRGVLRQVGAAYQFRHTRLLDQVRDWRRDPTRLDKLKSLLDELTNMIRERFEWPRADTSHKVGKDVTYHWWSAYAGQDAVLPEFAEDLDDLVGKKRWSDEQARAAALRDLLDDYQTLAENDPATFKPGLARALRLSASAFPWDEALRVSTKAVDYYRELAQTDPAAFLPGLAEATSDLAVRLRSLDRLGEALCLTRNIVDTTGRLAKADPATFLPVLAYSLSDLSRSLRQSQAEKSVSIQREAAAIYRELTDADPARFARRLSSSLIIWASMFKTLRRERDELTAIRYAFDAYRKRAERIAEIRRQIAESELAILWQYCQKPKTGKKLLGRTRSEQHKKILAAARRAAAACGKLAESQPTEFLPDLAEAANGLAAELKPTGMRRAARILVQEADRIRGQYRQSLDAPPGQAEEPPLDAMNRLALRLWKLGEQQEALAVGQMSRDLAPASRAGAATVGPKRASPARLFCRIREGKEVRSWRKNERFWRNSIQTRNLKQKAVNDSDARRDLVFSQREIAVALEHQSDVLDTLAFRRKVAGRTADAAAAMQQANDTHQKADGIYREISTESSPADTSDLPKSSGALAFRLKESALGRSDHSLPDQRVTPPVAGTLPQPIPEADSTQSGDPPEEAATS
jgi:hypothetical protein